MVDIPQFWGRSAQEGLIPQLCGKMNSQPMGMLGVSSCGGEEEWRYYIAVASTADAEAFEACQIPACTWAIFPGGGSGVSIQEL